MINKQNMISFVMVTALAFAGLLSLSQVNAQAQPEGDCIITINKAAFPADDTEFQYLITGAFDDGFILSDPSFSQTQIGINVGQTVTVTEDVTSGWTLQGIECVEGVTNCGMGQFIPCLTADVDGNSVTFQCLDNDTASCTFTNVVGTSIVPTLSEWGLIAMAAVIGAAGIFMALRRRKAAA